MTEAKIKKLCSVIKEMSFVDPTGVAADTVDVQDLLEEMADIFEIPVDAIEDWFEKA